VTTHIAVTGVGHPSAVSFLEAIAGPSIELYAADIDSYASGLYLVHPDNRWMLRRGAEPNFVDDVLERCIANKIDVLVPTVDSELLPLAKRRAEFEAQGTRLLLANANTLERALDKAKLVDSCKNVCGVPRTAIYDETTDLHEWPVPFFVKPRVGAGGRRAHRIDHIDHLAIIPRDGSVILQEFLPGREYSIDVLCTPAAEVLAVVPRACLKIDSGIAVTEMTICDERLAKTAADVARALGITYVANVQFRDDAEGTPRIMDLNARFSSTMPLTIAAGVNMPRIALDLVLGLPIPPDVGEFREIGMVRIWREHFVDIEEITRLEAAQRTLTI
jgi:carbamoyl-phosphate synthase large subunit